MKKKKYQNIEMKIIPLDTSEVIAYSYETGDFFSGKLEMHIEELEDNNSISNRFGYWDNI